MKLIRVLYISFSNILEHSTVKALLEHNSWLVNIDHDLFYGVILQGSKQI